MDNKVVKSINLLPESLRTDKNSKFLSSTIDQLIQPTQLERIDGYIGSTLASTYTSTNVYISESVPLRAAYQLSPALIVNDSLGNTSDVVAFDDLVNEIDTRGGITTNLDRLFRTEFYSYNPQIDWNKLINYQDYYWLEFGPEVVTITGVTNVDTEIVNKISYTATVESDISKTVDLINGMKITFSFTPTSTSTATNVLPAYYQNKEFIVEGVGSSIKLVDVALLVSSSKLSNSYVEHFGDVPFDQYSFDSTKSVPETPEYVTINRASRDLNPWSRYNRWTHADVIEASAYANNRTAVYPADKRAMRPIIEFAANLKLYNFGSVGDRNVDLLDTETTDITLVLNSPGYYVDGVLLADGHRVIFNAVYNKTYQNKICVVKYVKNKLTLTPLNIVIDAADTLVVGVTLGNSYSGTSWWQDSGQWKLAQSHTKLNQAPLFDLFDSNYVSYSDKSYDLSNFTGTKIFGYDIGTGTNDPVLGFPLKYKTISTVSNFLFKNYFMTDSFDVSTNSSSVTIPVSRTYLKRFNQFGNVWSQAEAYQMPIIHPTSSTATDYYELPLGLTNNPLNGPISTFTLSELGDHFNSMLGRNTRKIIDFQTMIDGNHSTVTNVLAANLPNISKYGTRLISNKNPMAFAQLFLGKKEHNVLDAISLAGDDYNQFKLAFLKRISEIGSTEDPIVLVDTALIDINKDKNASSPYFLSDMVAYGTDKISKSYTIDNPNKNVYPISSEFNLTSLSLRSVLVYLNGVQLTNGKDYVFDAYDSFITVLHTLEVDDTLTIIDYTNTEGSFVPPTPSKLGLYPKYEPSMYLDDTYISGPTLVIQGHDGSITVAYNDYRDAALLEFEKRVFNNIKTQYQSELFDIDTVSIGAFKDNVYSLDEINKIIQPDFIKWAGTYAVDYSLNSTFIETNSFTWNYASGYIGSLSKNVNGYWRAVYKYLYGTDRPHSHPWEMLGFTIQPSWWTGKYGNAPYLPNNQMWLDLAAGKHWEGSVAVINSAYVRPNLSSILPVDATGKLVKPNSLMPNATLLSRQRDWKFGDQGPVETAWRRSSYMPFTMQRLMALAKPAMYAAMLYDVSRISKNKAGQWVYGENYSFLNLKNASVHADNSTLTSGYSVYVSEIGKRRSTSYLEELKSDLSYANFNLFYKVGGFVSKDKLQIVIDAYDPSSTSPGAVLPQEDYKLLLNTSNPIKSASISGIVVQKVNGHYVVKGYDRVNPYFTTFAPIRNTNSAAMTVGGVSAPYVNWSAGTADAGNFYQQGQIVSYGPNFYLTKVSHRSTGVFESTYFQLLPELPVNGGATVQLADQFESTTTQIAYGTTFSRIQDVYDVIIGYGAWLETQGFIFDEFNLDLGLIINWDFSSKEFLYWTTQNWATNSVITLSPFADKIKYSLASSVVDNIFDNFYEYSLLLTNGLPFPRKNISVDRQDGICTISTINTDDGIYFATLHSVQKEHAIVFNNTTIFNDTIYDIGAGYRQKRMKLSGFRTKDWNGDYFSPGFVYDEAKVSNWVQYRDYQVSSVVKFNGLYYSAINNVKGSEYFDFTQWSVLAEKPVSGLLPNFDYKINQFEDFYSLDIDNFDAAQQRMAQHLTGYTPRVYLNNIFTNPISQYKFYQGFIKEKGTKNSVSKLSKASIYNSQGELSYTEEWAFRLGHYGSYSTFNELEIPLVEGKIVENPQIINFSDTEYPEIIIPNDTIYYSTPSSILIAPKDYTASSTFVTNNDEFKLNTAGYVRLDDVTATAYTENSLLDIANNRNINEGDVIWLGFKNNSIYHSDGWDVLRYTRSLTSINNAFISVPGVEITFSTKLFHGLAVGQVVSVSQYNSTLDGIYIVKSIPSLTEFTVDSTLSYINTSSLPAYGLLFEFTTVRFNSVDSLPADQLLLSLPVDTKLWVDNGGSSSESGRWAVYQKVQNYSKNLDAIVTPFENLHLGRSISKGKTDGILAVGATSDSAVTSKVFVYDNNVDRLLFNYSLNESKLYSASNSPTGFGTAVVYDDCPFIDINTTTNTTLTKYGLVFAGAPLASNMRTSGTTGSVRYSTGDELTGSSYINQGAVKISSIDYTMAKESVYAYVLLSPYPASYQQYGHSLVVEHNTSTKLLLVGAPGSATTGTGAVYAYNVSNTSSTEYISPLIQINVRPYTSGISVSSGLALSIGDQWGYSISGSDDLNIIAISAPGYNTTTANGFVAIFTDKNLTTPQIIKGTSLDAGFGEAVLVSSNGDYVFISVPRAKNNNQSYGLVKVYIKTIVNNSVVFVESPYPIISNPVPGHGMRFGTALSINTQSNTLAISATGNNTLKTTFDIEYDSKSTKFYDIVRDSGTVYLYNRKADRFILIEEVPSVSTNPGTNYGRSVIIDDSSLFVGAPSNNQAVPNNIYQFSKLDTDSLKTLREQDDLVAVDTLQKIAILDSYKEELVDYLEVIDPLKGKISGLAEQELKFKSAFDPAVYSIGISNSTVDTSANWLDEHVGELWWDLSTVKYTWYEQGELSYRKNSWGRLFPGSTIDVYEWVGSEYLPTEWSTLADTAAGLVSGISGQPKYVNNSVISVKQVYNSISNSFSNYYFYWVKNKTTVPSTRNRRISGYEVASIIADPSTYGLKHASILSKDSILLSNINNMLVGDRMHLNLSSDIIDNNIPRHTEWALMQENSADSMPNALLEKKLIDSLLGHDSLGNLVPDTALSFRNRYGIGIRPRQTLFKDRLFALRNLVEFTNSVLIKNQIVGNYNFDNLNSQESVPDITTNQYDQVVEDEMDLQLIDTRLLKLAKITIQTVTDGKITSVYIDDPGFGYITPPTVRIVGDNSTAVITTEIDATGSVISARIVNPGSGYTVIPKLEVRPYSVIVLVDTLYNGKWTKFVYDYSQQWIRSNTQKFNTTLYWKYVDWKSDTYNQFKDFTVTLDNFDQLSGIVSGYLSSGQYIKIKNSGAGRYVILEKADLGTFIPGFNIVYSERGTIQLLDDLWNIASGKFGFDQRSSYDQTLYDQTPDIELHKILTALKYDIFVNELKINWNLFFFNAVKYALSEQKNLDWAFKTSFINVKNLAGRLDQRPVYKLQDSSYYEQYLKEVKPYHTNIRSFTTDYTLLDNSAIQTSDTDRASLVTMKFDRTSRTAEIDNSLVTDQLVCNGFDTAFDLSWLANPDKFKISVTLDGVWVLGADYTIDIYTELLNGYHKEKSKIVFLNYVPNSGQVLAVTYEKNIKLLNAVDRAIASYTSTNSQIELDLSQLMTGIEYPGTKFIGTQFVQGISPPFSRWDIDNVSYGAAPWATNVSSYHKTAVTSTATADSNSLSLRSIDNIVIGQLVNIVSTTTNVFNTAESVMVTTIDIDTRTVGFNSSLTTTVYPGSIIEFWNYDSAAGIINYELQSGDMGPIDYETIVDGDQFITPNNSYAPEELIPGRVADSLGINVYTKASKGAPTIFTSYADIYSGSTTTVSLSVVPININSITVSFNNTLLTYNTTSNFTTSTEYTINWASKSIVVPPQTVTGQLGYTILGIGGGMTNEEAGVLDNSYVITGQSTVSVYSLSPTAKSAYVTVNGVATTNYDLVSTTNSTSSVSVRVRNLPAGNNLVHAWFFANRQKYYNVVTEQRFTIGNTAQSSFTLLNPPGNLGPVEDKVMLELYNGVTRSQLVPPYVSYYDVSDISVNTFAVDKRKTYTSGTFTSTNVRAYLNGVLMRSNFDYTVNSTSGMITVDSNILSIGAVVAVIGLPANNYNYNISGSTLTLASSISNTTLKVITYTDHDDMSMRTDTFKGTPNKRYKLERPVINDNYVWVRINGVPLTNRLDYVMLDDQVTVQIGDSIQHNISDTVVITTISSKPLASNVVGYRIFNDIFGRTHFKRLSKENTTYLTRPLLYTDTEITVADPGVLTVPIISKRIPGVVIINGERIEFFKIDGNKLTQLRRGTLGTSPNSTSAIGTKVIDQGVDQTVPFTETIYKQTHLTTSTNTFTISTMSNDIVGDGITLIDDIDLVDQVSVYYGGKLLRKTGMIHQDISLSYDSPRANIVGSIGSILDLPAYTVSKGTAYIVTTTNQIWIYTAASRIDSINGYEYQGLNYLPPEFSISIDTPKIVIATETVTGGQPPSGSGWVLHETTSTMQIQPGWIMQDANGYQNTVIYSGHNTLFNGWSVGFANEIAITWPMTFIEPKMQHLSLNIDETITPGTLITVVQKLGQVWTGSESLLTSDKVQAKFLQNRSAELPDSHYYGR